MSTSSGINYAKLLGFESVAAAAILAAFYVLLLQFNYSYPWIRPANAVSTFCTIRIVAFIIRAVAAKSDSAGRNSSLLVGDEILFSVGFLVLLYSAYTLASNVRAASGVFVPTGAADVCLAVGQRLFVSAGMIAATVLDIIGVIRSHSTDPRTVDLGKNLQKASMIVVLVLTVLQTYLMLRVTWAEISPRVGADDRERGFWGVMHGYRCYIRCAISLLLLIREAFATATIMSDTAKLNDEHFWYPLIALPEILAVVLYLLPGVVVPSAVPVEIVTHEATTSRHTTHFDGSVQHSITVERSFSYSHPPLHRNLDISQAWQFLSPSSNENQQTEYF
ncbi:hypothetical protein BD779DRAFT_1671505 [Infundibulicybe gibba]|nr:hypothetical protein BD779DRAFT_1671505 [Infundibulicybe gibba]